MSKIHVDVILKHGIDDQGFADSFNSETEAYCKNILENIPCCLTMMVEEDFIETMRNDPRVSELEVTRESFQASLPSEVTQSKRFTSTTPSTQGTNGADYSGLQFYLDTNQMDPGDTSGDPNTIGRETSGTGPDDYASYIDESYTSRWAGKNVDLITMEGGLGIQNTTYQNLHDLHPDFQCLSGEEHSHNDLNSGTYVYQCTVHSYMVGTININPFSVTRNEYNITVSGGSSYTFSGSDRNGNITGSNPTLTFNAGDKITFTLDSSVSGHPFEIRLSSGGSAVNDMSIIGNGNNSGTIVWETRTNSRFFPMDWSSYGLNSSSNNQITSNNCLTSHATGVLSVAAGAICGFAKRASMRSTYIVSDGPIDVINAIISWHNSKPVNPETGERNATIMIGEYQYLLDSNRGIPIDSIQTIEHPTLGTATRPSGGWSNDYTEFVKRDLIPRQVTDSVNGTRWCIVTTAQYRYTSLYNAIQSAANAGVHFITAAGNNGGTYPKYSNYTSYRITCTGTYNYTTISYGNANGSVTSSQTSWYTGIAYGPHGTDTAIDVAAGYNSERYPGLDGYSNRGPGIDIVGLGANTWSASPSSYYGTYRWGMFSGTSCAAPTVVGKAACLLERHRYYHGSWADPAGLKRLLVASAKNISTGFDSGHNQSLDWSNTPSASTSSFSNRIDSGLLRISSSPSHNGGIKFSEAAGTTGLRAFFDAPNESFQQALHGRRYPTIGGIKYPRPRVCVGRNSILPDQRSA